MAGTEILQKVEKRLRGCSEYHVTGVTVEMRGKQEEDRALSAKEKWELGRAWLLLVQADDNSRSMKIEHLWRKNSLQLFYNVLHLSTEEKC